jgi:hypothetical protein
MPCRRWRSRREAAIPTGATALTSHSDIAAAAWHRAAAGVRTVRRAVIRRSDMWLYGLDQQYPEYDAYSRRRHRQLGRAIGVVTLAARSVAAVTVDVRAAVASRWAQRPTSDRRLGTSYRPAAGAVHRDNSATNGQHRVGGLGEPGHGTRPGGADQPASSQPASASRPADAAQPASTAQPSTAQPNTAQPSTAQPASTAQPSTAQPASTAQPSTARPASTAQPAGAAKRGATDLPVAGAPRGTPDQSAAAIQPTSDESEVADPSCTDMSDPSRSDDTDPPGSASGGATQPKTSPRSGRRIGPKSAEPASAPAASRATDGVATSATTPDTRHTSAIPSTFAPGAA